MPMGYLTSCPIYFSNMFTLKIYKTELIFYTAGEQNWRMVVVLFCAWTMVFLGMNKGIKSSGKVMYFATLFPYAVLFAFFVRGITLDGAMDGVKYMFNPDVSVLVSSFTFLVVLFPVFHLNSQAGSCHSFSFG